MGEDWKYYSVEDYNTWKRKQGRNFRSPPRANYLAAANHIKNILDGKKLSWAATCGLAMLCLGSRRDMPDIHIVYDDRDFQRIKTKLEADKRVSLPKGMIPLFPAKILIATGPKYKDASCMENVEVEVDLVPPGMNGAPNIDIFRKNQVLLRLNLDGKMNNFRGLNMLYLVKTTLQYCKSEDLAWDPKKDITFLCQSYASEIEKIRHQLNQKEIQELFLSTPYFAKLSADDQRKCYHALLDREPPPIMSITPPPPQFGHRASNSAPGQLPKPPLLSQKSSPSLNTAARHSSSFLSPPLPGKPKSRPAEAPLNPPANNPTGPQAQLVPIYSTTADSRSRYRAISAPNTSNEGPNKNPQITAVNASRPLSMDSRTPHQQAPNQFYSTSRGVGVQNGPNFSRPHMVQNQAHAPMSAQTMGPISQKSMPDLKPSPSATVPIPTHPHNIIPPGPRASHAPTPSSSHAITPAGIAGAQRVQSKLSPQNTPQGSPQRSHNNDSARQPNPSGPSGTKAVPIPAQGKAPLAAQRIEEYRSNATSNSTPSSILIPAEGSATQTAGLRLVGPDGLYRPPEKPAQPTRSAPTRAPNQSSGPRVASGPVSRPPIPNQTSLAFELDASPAQAKPRSISPQELPTEPVTSTQPQANVPQSTPVSQNQQYKQSNPSAQTQPVAPPEFAHLVHNVTSQHQLPVTTSTLTPNIQNELLPNDNIPESLMAGGKARQRSPSRSPQRSPQNSPQLSPQPSPNMQVNASKYRYYSPSSSPNNGIIPSYAAPVSEYKAYSGPISPPAPGQLQKSHTYGASPAAMGNVATKSQGSAYTTQNTQPAQYLFPDSNPLAENLTPPISPPDKCDSHHTPQKQSMSMSSKDTRASVMGAGASGYAAFSYHNNEELHMHTQTQTQTQYQQPRNEAWFAKYATQEAQSQIESQSQQHSQLPQQQLQQWEHQPQVSASKATEPQYTNAHSDQTIQNTSPNQQPIAQAPLQWTHPALQHRNNDLTQPHTIQTQHPLTHSNIATYDSPTTSLHQRNTSHDSDKLAQEYQSELPKYGQRGYGSGNANASEEAQYVHKPEDGWKKDVDEGKGNGSKRISEMYEFIDFT
ncbi:hypothetical protein K505DRAFT_420395 [Melanomma pulvis-pyrius CBS 109.77]|uniref:Uncharacterized protein n=1 Tax=Melanomma pulvis-pyrius CBS 109.77 TaxID=1314802 RepID=A0A6A6WZP2_9PLEO|nr:hypothetical protein K505DRAFT_420395 [Melanomma pulvis-pyrius CBS 109.77]